MTLTWQELILAALFGVVGIRADVTFMLLLRYVRQHHPRCPLWVIRLEQRLRFRLGTSKLVTDIRAENERLRAILAGVKHRLEELERD